MTRRCLRVSKLSYVEQLPANYFGVFMPAIEVFIGALLCDFGRLPPISPWMALTDPPANLTCTVHTIFLGHDASRRWMPLWLTDLSMASCRQRQIQCLRVVCRISRWTYPTVRVLLFGYNISPLHACMSVCMYVTGNAWIETNERACCALQDRKSILNTFYKVFRILSIVQDRQKSVMSCPKRGGGGHFWVCITSKKLNMIHYRMTTKLFMRITITTSFRYVCRDQNLVPPKIYWHLVDIYT